MFRLLFLVVSWVFVFRLLIDDLEEIFPFRAALAELLGIIHRQLDEIGRLVFTNFKDRAALEAGDTEFLDYSERQVLPGIGRRLDRLAIFYDV